MKRTFTISLVISQLCVTVLAFQALAQVQESGRPAAFVSALAQAMSRRDRAAVAEMVRYPATANVAGVNVPITDRMALTQLYDSIFTAELRCMVDASAGPGGDVRVERGAVTFAQGRLRAEDVSGALKITRISVPPVSGVAARPPSKPQRVTRSRQQFSGRLYADGVDSYIVGLRKGNVVEARIEQFPGRSAALRVQEMKTGKSLDKPAPKTSDGAAPAPRYWTDTIREDGDYRIDVVRMSPYCAPSFTYLLTVTIK